MMLKRLNSKIELNIVRGTKVNEAKNYIIIALLVAVSILSYLLWSNNNDSADTIRQLKESNSRLETRLTTAQTINESQYNRLTKLQAEIEQLRESITSDIHTVETITGREQGNQTIIERSLARIKQLEELIDEIGKANQ